MRASFIELVLGALLVSSRASYSWIAHDPTTIRGYQHEAPASEWWISAGTHSLALRAGIRNPTVRRSSGIHAGVFCPKSGAGAHDGVVQRTVKVQRHLRQPGGKGSLTIEGSIVSPQDRFPRRGETIRLKGTIKWENTDPPRRLIVGLRLRDERRPDESGISADEDWGRIVSITKRDDGNSGELEWQGEVKANLQGDGGTYYLQVDPFSVPRGRSRDGRYRDEEKNQPISLILPLRGRDTRKGGKGSGTENR